MAVTVLDSSDLPAILADAGVEIEQQPETKEPEGDTKKPETETKKPDVETHDDPDDVEGDDGLTPRQKREFTQQMQKAIGKKHRMQKEAEEFAAAQYNERQLAESRAKLLEQELEVLRTGKGKIEVPVEKAPEKPQRHAYTNESDYIDAMVKFGVEQGLRERAEADARAERERVQAQMVETAKGRIARALELVPDYAEVTGAVDLEVPRAVAGYMQKSEMFAELGYHLAKNPDLLVSLAKLPPDEQLVKIGKIESTLTPFGSGEGHSTQNDKPSSKEASNGQAKPAPSAENTGDIPSKPRGKAAPVFTPIEGAGSAGAAKDSRDMNIREAIEDFSKRNRLNLGMRKRH